MYQETQNVLPNLGQSPQPTGGETVDRGNKKKSFLLSAALGCGGALLLALALFLLGVFRTTNEYEGDGYSSAEDAALAFVEAMQDGDIEAMLATFAIETAVENFDFEKYYYDCRDYPVYFTSYSDFAVLPTDMEFGYDLALHRRAAQVTDWVAKPFFMAKEGAFDDFEEFCNSYPPYETVEDKDAFYREYQSFDAEDYFSDIKIGDVYENERVRALFDIERARENYRKRIEAYGAEDMKEMIVEFKLNGETYTVGLTTICYDGRWYNFSESPYQDLSGGGLIACIA